MTIMQLTCDIELVGMVIYWVIWGRSFVYPLSVGFLGIAKVLINVNFTHYLRFCLKRNKWIIHSKTDSLFHLCLDKTFKILIFSVESSHF